MWLSHVWWVMYRTKLQYHDKWLNFCFQVTHFLLSMYLWSASKHCSENQYRVLRKRTSLIIKRCSSHSWVIHASGFVVSHSLIKTTTSTSTSYTQVSMAISWKVPAMGKHFFIQYHSQKWKCNETDCRHWKYDFHVLLTKNIIIAGTRTN